MLATAQKNMEKKKAGLIPGTGTGAGTDSDTASNDRIAMETAPEIDSDNAFIGCVPGTNNQVSGTKDTGIEKSPAHNSRKGSGSRRKGHGLAGLFRRKSR